MPNNAYIPTREEVATQAEEDLTNEEIATRIEELRSEYPQWFVYSDTLGGRPIDGMLRELFFRNGMRQEQNQARSTWEDSQVRQIEQNRAVAPEFTDAVQSEAGPGEAIQMGPVM